MFSTMCSNAFVITALKAFVTANLYFCSYSNAQQYTETRMTRQGNSVMVVTNVARSTIH
jgi:hypothetical protein